MAWQATGRFGLIAWIALALVAWQPGAHAQPERPTARHLLHHFKEPRPLTLDPTRLAVLGADRGALARAEIRATLTGAGLDADRAEAWALPRWSLVPTTVPNRTADAVERIVATLSRAPAARGADAPLAFVSPVFVDAVGGPMFVTPHILVGFNEGVSDDDARRALAETGAGAILARDWAGMPGAYRIASPSRSGLEVLGVANALARRPEVAWAEPDMAFTGRGDLMPNDTGFINCWGLHNTGQFSGAVIDMDMDGPEAWDTTTGDPAIITLVIDTGVDAAHPDINQVTGIDTTSDSGSGEPINQYDNHGTPVAGCVSAVINNSLGTVGIAPGTNVSSARTFISTNPSGNWSSVASWTVDSLTFGESIGARVSNNSNYYGFQSSAISSKYSSTKGGGMVHFGSAGNDNQNAATYPASLSTVNAISALDVDGDRASFSNFGPLIAYAAPGVFVYTTDRTGSDGWSGSDYTFANGTSFASPYAAGVAALVLSQNPSLSAPDVEEILRISAVDLGPEGRDDTYGWGFVNAANALDALTEPPAAFTLTLPADGATGVDLQPQLNWQNALLASSYRVIVDSDPSLLTPEIDAMTTESFYDVGAGLLFHDTTYTWQIIALNANGQTLSSPTTATFTTAPPPPPDDFALLSPLNGATDVPTGPLLDWEDAARAEDYLVEVDNDITFASPEVSQTVPATLRASELQLPDGTLLHDTQHYWRVTAQNVSGGTLGSPDVSGFRTAAPPPCPCPGDIDGDCDVDVFDFGILAGNFGSTVTPNTGGDFDGDGDVDVFDFGVLAASFGCTG